MVRVGLGTGSRQEKMSKKSALVHLRKEALQADKDTCHEQTRAQTKVHILSMYLATCFISRFIAAKSASSEGSRAVN